MSIQDGQPVDAANSNPSWISKNVDDTTPSKLGMANTDPVSGASVTNSQRELNSLATFLGKALNAVYNALPSWTNNDVGASTDPVKTRADALTQKFNATTGHAHSGAAGDGAPVVAANLASVPFRAYPVVGTNYTTSAASSDDVSTLMAGRLVSTGPAQVGVVTTGGYNQTLLRNAATGDLVDDSLGNAVYGRITHSGSVWTHSYYSLVSGVETVYTFASPLAIVWAFQEVHNPMVDPPTYDPSFILPSANATADVEPATATLAGKVTLGNATAAAVAASGATGTANGRVANADHAHAGVHKLTAAATDVLGDVQLAASGTGFSVGVVGQVITFAMSWVMTTLGDLIYGGASGTPTRLAGNTTTTRKFLRQTGTGTVSAAPVWDTIIAADVPTMVGAGPSTAGTAGLVPTPAAGDDVKFLRGDGSFQTVVTSGGNLTTDVFSGNGSTTGFTLSVTPGSKDNTQVTINGVYQQKSTYSLSGTALTFSTAPPSGTNNIEVVSGTTLSVGTPSNGTVGRAQLNTSSAFIAPTTQQFTSGSGNYTAPTPAPLYIRVRMVGGGGGGASSSTTSGVNGSNGGDTTFGTCTAGKGSGGNYALAAGAGGTPTLGAGYTGLALPGGAGQTPTINTNFASGGLGGSSAFGGAGSGGDGNGGTAGGAGGANTGAGGGGGGGQNSGVSNPGSGGGAGAFIDAIATPTAGQVIAYAVGAGGAGGSGGSTLHNGGAGGSGVIIVQEFYQ